MRRRLRSESGVALIMMLAIAAMLAILAATVVAVTVNTQSTTATVRTKMTAFDYAQAALRSGVLALTQTQPWPSGGSFSQTALEKVYLATYPSPAPAPNSVKAYVDQVPVDTTPSGQTIPAAGSSSWNGRMWVQASATYNGQTAVVRQLVGQVSTSQPFSAPVAAIYTDANVNIGPGGSGNVFAVKADGTTPDTSLTAGVFGGGPASKFVGNWSSNLAVPGNSGLTVSVKTNGTVTNPALGINTQAGVGGVASLQSTLGTAPTTWSAVAQQAANPGGTVVPASTISGTSSYTATGDVYVDLGGTGTLTLPSGNFTFHSLYVNGNLAQTGGPGTLTCTALHVNGNLTVQGGKFIDHWGPAYVAGSVTIGGNTTDLQCPILATPGPINVSGGGNAQAADLFGSAANPILIVQTGGASNTPITWGLNGVFTGVMVNMDGGVTLPGGNKNMNAPTSDIVGAIWAEGNVDFGGNTQVCYNPTAVGNTFVNLPAQAATTTTSVVTGGWQELSPSGN